MGIKKDLKKQNCWEFKKCERQQGGKKEHEVCTCLAAKRTYLYDGINNGRYAGRCCWRMVGTLCNGNVQGVFADKIKNCRKCDFYQMVKDEEGEKFKE